MSGPLQGRTLFVSGGSRGIGLAIAKRAARDGANVALIAKTGEPHPKLEGTVHTAAAEIEAAGGRALPVVGDIRDDASVADAVARTVDAFGGIDVAVNNASAINLAGTEAMDMKRYDLMQDINTRGTYLVTKACLPHLRRSGNAHVLTMSPPISLQPRWLGPHVAYTIAKYGMSLCTLGFAEELRADGIACNALWPRTAWAASATAARARATSSLSRTCSRRRASPTSTSTPTAARTPSCRPTSSSTTDRRPRAQPTGSPSSTRVPLGSRT